MTVRHRLRVWRMRRRYRARARPSRRSRIRLASVDRKQGPEDLAWAKAQVIIAEAREAATELRRRALADLSLDGMAVEDAWPEARAREPERQEHDSGTDPSMLAEELAREIEDLSTSYLARMEDLRRSLDGAFEMVDLTEDGLAADDADLDDDDTDVVVDLVAHEGSGFGVRRIRSRSGSGSEAS